MIQMKTAAEIAKMHEAGIVVERALAAMRAAVAPGVTTADLDAIAARVIREAGAVPSFKGYHGFPATICASINDEIVHGIPSRRRALREGDVVSLDCGAILDGWHGDSAITVGVGEISPELQRMLDVCEEAMWRGLAAGVAGNRIGDISHAVEDYVRAQGGYGIVEGYGGHGIGTDMHQEPFVPNVGRGGRGRQMAPGLCLAIEPMIMMGKRHTRVLTDEWTVVTVDGSWAAHFEHTFAVTPDGPVVLTASDGGAERLGRLATAQGAAN